jgi:hypothetical protein
MIFSDALGSLITFDIIKYGMKNRLRLPDFCIFVNPSPKIVIEDLNFLKDPLLLLSSSEEDFIHEVPQTVKMEELFLDFEKGELISFNEDHRLNFFLTDPSLVKKFPRSIIISSENEPIREHCIRLTDLFK